MSLDFNYKLWLSAKRDLKHLIKKQDLLKGKEPIKNTETTFKILSQMYILYAELVKKLCYLYKETFQVQKKEVIRNLLEPVTNRFLEIKTKLKEMELSMYVYLDEVLVEQKLTPYDLLIWNSSFLYSRPKDITVVFKEPKKFREISFEKLVQAITKIQSHERARQARLLDKNQISSTNYANKISYSFSHENNFSALVPVKRTIFLSNFLKTSEMCEIPLNTENTEQTHVDETEIIDCQLKSALIIQRVWKNYKAQKILKMKRNFKQLLYGVVKGRKILNQKEHEQNILCINKKCENQEEMDIKYLLLMQDERERLLDEKTANIMEDISDHVREWFKEFYEKTGDFHPYPDANKSGTVLFLTDETMNLSEFKEYIKTQQLSKAERKNLEEKSKQKKEKEKEKYKKEKLKEMKRQNKILKSGAYDISNELKTNKNVQNMEINFSQYSSDWNNVDEYLNKTQDAIPEWVTESQLAVIHKELRSLVDKYMRTEYNILKQAWSIDTKKKFKRAKTKEKRIPKKKKSMKTKDLTADRSIESLYQELEAAEIIHKYPVKGFDDYLGDFSILADNLRNPNNLVALNPAKADVRFAIQDIMFGMGAVNVEKPKTLCLVGPANTGKKLLCNIIASEIGALFINLSPEKTFQFSENIKYLIHVVMKVAKAFQPTIIFIEDAHRIFWKKVPKDQVGIKPTLLKNVFKKFILNAIGKKDKIMIIGTSSLPWSADKMFKKIFTNILMIPDSDYGTIYLMWHEFLTQNVNRNYFEDPVLSVLAKVFQKYNSGDISDNVASTLNIKRRLRLPLNSINPDEFLDYFCSQSNPLFPPEQKVLEKYKQWYKKTNIYGKLRALKETVKNKKK